jgi:DNA (cytosine-5)-methyltransferase 1
MGFPCVSFSNLGKRQGFADKRAQTVFHVLKLVDHHRPAAVVVENVRALLTHDNGKSFLRLRQEFEKIGYSLKHCLLDTAKVSGIPHHRERVFVVAMRDTEHHKQLDLIFNEAAEANDFREYLEPDPPDKVFYDDRFKCYPLLQRKVLRNDRIYQLRYFEGGYVRELEHCPCLTGSCGTGGHIVPLVLDGGRIRKLTTREVFNFQGFPPTYDISNVSDSALYKLAGNCITVRVGAMVLERVIEALKT